MKREVRNASGKLVCEVDDEQKSIEIRLKNDLTIIRFSSDGTIQIENKQQ